jgi:DNA-binding transcriptional LysR family regulator
MLMTGANHPLAKMDSVSVESMVEHPIILPKAGHTRKTMDKLFRPYQGQLRIARELPSIVMIKAFVASGMGVSLINESFAFSRGIRRLMLPVRPLSHNGGCALCRVRRRSAVLGALRACNDTP